MSYGGVWDIIYFRRYEYSSPAKRNIPLEILIISIIVGVSVPAFFVGKRALRNRRLRQLAAMPFPDEWENTLEKNVGLYRHLPDTLKEQLRNDIKLFVNEKLFEGLGGLEMTDEIKVTIAAEASMLLLNRRNRDYPGLSSILVYPGAYVAKQNTPVGGGVYDDGRSVRLGESWHHGSVVLAWDYVRQGAVNSEDGHNVVLHEFAHQLDQEDGIMVDDWTGVLRAEIEGKRLKEIRRQSLTVAPLELCENLRLENKGLRLGLRAPKD